MSRYLSPLALEGIVASEGLATVALAATTFFTTPNKDDYNGALYEADIYLRVNTTDGGTTPTVGITITATEGADAIAYVVPLMTLAGAIDTSAALTADQAFHGRVFFRADKNTAVQWTRVSGGTPSNDGNFDVFILVHRIK